MTGHYQFSLFPHLHPEDSNLELKSTSGGRLPDDIWKTVSAFANTEGGTLILGVSPKGTPIGLSDSELDKLQQDILSLCQGGFNHQITPDIQRIGSVISIIIPPYPAAFRPIYSKSRGATNGSYIRVGSSNIVVPDEVRNQFAVAARGGAEIIEQPDLLYTDIFSNNLIENYKQIIQKNRGLVYKDLGDEEILRKVRALGKGGSPTLFGILAFAEGYTVQELTAPTVSIVVTQYPGDSKVSTENPAVAYLDNREFNGNVLEQFEAAFAYIKSRLPISGVIESSGKRKDYLVIPEVAIREALANAIAHRDYSTYSSRIQVSIYSDRLEITNPGTSLVPLEDLDTTSSISRNPILMNYMKEYHITEQLARGIRTIRESLRGAGLAEPLFENIGGSFRVTLSGSAFLSRGDHRWLEQFRIFRLNERQLTALTHLKNSSDGINNGEYREINNMSGVGDDRRAKNDLTKLVKLNLIVPRGENRHRKYFIRDDIQ